MKSFFNRLFRRTITFDAGINNHVNVVDTDKRKENNDLFSGVITEIDFDNREVVIENKFSLLYSGKMVVKFDKIVTISRMKDGRLRMWIKVED